MDASSGHPNAIQDQKLLQAAGLALAALTDLCNRHDLPPGQVTLIGVESRTWPDASLGDPVPGRMYAQILTPGFVIRLQAAGTLHTYHTSLQGPPRRLEAPRPPGLDEDHPLIAGAMLALAQRLGVGYAQIEFDGAEPRTAVVPGAQPPAHPETVSHTGAWAVRLRHQDRIYHYQGPDAGPLVLVDEFSLSPVTQ